MCLLRGGLVDKFSNISEFEENELGESKTLQCV